MYFPQTTIYSICSNCGGEGNWYVELPLVNLSFPAGGTGGQTELISVFSDFTAGRNLQPNTQSCCKGGISPPQTCLQATVVIRGSWGFGSPLLLATKGSSSPICAEAIGQVSARGYHAVHGKHVDKI